MVDSAAKMEGTTSNNAKPADDKKNHSNLDEAEITRKVDAAKSQASQVCCVQRGGCTHGLSVPRHAVSRVGIPAQLAFVGRHGRRVRSASGS